MSGGLIALITVASIVLCCALSCIWCCISNSLWRNERIKELKAVSEIVKTSKGEIEISKKGEAPYLLALHGTTGIHDGLSCYFDEMLNRGFGIITPSRPGYGRTPLETGSTSAEAADALAALLDELKIDHVVIFGVSGGGPTAL